MITNQKVKKFWENNPVAAPKLEIKGSYEFFRKFDNRREAANCEPYNFSNRIHAYDQSRGKKILDIGCGNGYVLSQYKKFGAEVYGIDLTKTAIELSQKRFQLCNYQGEFKLTDGDSIPYPDNFFDMVCSMGVLHHIERPERMINEICRVLKPSGTLIMMLYNKNSFRNKIGFRIKKYFGGPKFRNKTIQQIRNMNDGIDCPLVKVYSKNDVELLLSDFHSIRFVVNKLSWNEFFIIPIIGKIMNRLLLNCSESFAAKRWGWNLYIIAKKN